MTVSSPVMFPVGATSSTMQCVDIAIVDDGILEGNESFTVRLTNATLGVEGGNYITVITITDNDG